jgi:FixJ family two-component response regulator
MANAKYVFVVDADPSARMGIARLMRSANYEVRDFDSAKSFLDALSSETPCSVVMDVSLPELSCDELVEQLEARGLELPIIVVTTHDDAETRRNAQKLKAAGFFRKPVDGTALLDAIEWSMRSRGQESNSVNQ